MSYLKLGDKIIVLREEKDLSRKELAEQLDIPYNTFSKYETNERQPDYATLKAICYYFDVSTDFMLDSHKSISNNFTEIAGFDLTDEEKVKIIEYAKFLKSQRKPTT